LICNHGNAGKALARRSRSSPRGSGELPADREVIAYCRGPYCVLSFEAVSALRARGYLVRRLEDGYRMEGCWLADRSGPRRSQANFKDRWIPDLLRCPPCAPIEDERDLSKCGPPATTPAPASREPAVQSHGLTPKRSLCRAGVEFCTNGEAYHAPDRAYPDARVPPRELPANASGEGPAATLNTMLLAIFP
jgi:hypothetical protein